MALRPDELRGGARGRPLPELKALAPRLGPRQSFGVPAAPGLGRLFDHRAVAAVYHALTDHPLWAEQNLRLLEHVPPGTRRLLDLGAGTGVGTRAMARALAGRGEVVGLELAAPMVRIAERRAAQAGLRNLRFVQGDAGALDFPAASFDAVVACSFLYLTPDPERVLAEAARVLRPEGRLVFMEPRDEAELRGLLRAVGRRLPGAWRHPGASARLATSMLSWRIASGVEGRLAAATLRQRLAAAGFDAIRLEPTLGTLGQHVVATRGGSGASAPSRP